uniref:Uncharacterized protein n=1 Tax=Arundo donax TaxID=35708 RepID=A0A0A8ZUI9_ARUDO
MISGRGRIKT